MKNILYIISIILIAISIILILEFPDSQRMNLIAGFSTILGFIVNASAFFMSNKIQANRNFN